MHDVYDVISKVGVPHAGVPLGEEDEWDMEWRDSGRCVSASLTKLHVGKG